jgi:hypothetical protein
MGPAGEVVGNEKELALPVEVSGLELPMDIPGLAEEELTEDELAFAGGDDDEFDDADATPAVLPARAATPRREIRATGTAPAATHISRTRGAVAATETGTNRARAAASSMVVVTRPTGSAVSHPAKR